MNSDKSLIIVAGPTASGKTKYAIQLAKSLNAILINTDSRQIYKFMDIGTNKGTITALETVIDVKASDERKFQIQEYDVERSGVSGYMFDIVRPNEFFSLSEFLYLSKYLIEYFGRLNKKIIFVGGTGLYVDALINNTILPTVRPNRKLRNKLQKLSREQLYDELYKINETKARILNDSDKNNPRRLVRKIEIALAGKELKSSVKSNYYKLYYPVINRNELYKKINLRVEEMFEEGFIDEVKNLINMGYTNTKPMQGMGYKEVIKFLNDETSFHEMKERIKQAHRNYAARQFTWFEGLGRNYKLTRVDYSC